MTPTYALEVETLEKCVPDIQHMFVAHHGESEVLQDKLSFEVDWAQYRTAEQLGILRCYILRKDGIAIGYAWFTLHTHAHHKGEIFAVNDSLYLLPVERHTQISPMVIDAIEADLKRHGAAVITYAMKAHKTYSHLLSTRGYAPLETMWGKYIKDQV